MRQLAVLGLLLLTGCGVTIQTGPEDEQRQEEVADYRAKEIRSEWADRIRAASPVQKAEIFKNLVDSVSAGYLRYGRGLADDWDAANDHRGTPVPGSEMRDLIQRSNETQAAVFAAYEDVLEHALGEIRETFTFDQQTLDLLDRYAEQFYKVNSIVFYPPETAEDYRSQIDNLQAATERMSDELASNLRRY